MISVFIGYCRKSSAASRLSAEESVRGFARMRSGEETPALEALDVLAMLAVLAVLVMPGGVRGVFVCEDCV